MKNNIYLIDIDPLMMHGLSHTVPNSCFYGMVISTLMLYSLLMYFSICSNTSSKGWIMLNFKLMIEWNMMLLVNISRVNIYLSAPEAAWQILAYDICCQNPSVSCLKLHEPNLNRHQYFLTPGNQNSPS